MFMEEEESVLVTPSVIESPKSQTAKVVSIVNIILIVLLIFFLIMVVIFAQIAFIYVSQNKSKVEDAPGTLALNTGQMRPYRPIQIVEDKI
jgi:biopolymer transport protein ExbD